MANKDGVFPRIHLQGAAAEARAWLQSLGALMLDSDLADQAAPVRPSRHGAFSASLEGLFGNGDAGLRRNHAVTTSFLDKFDDRPVMFVSAEARAVEGHIEMITLLDMAAVLRPGLHEALNELFDLHAGWAALVINLDDFGGIGLSTINRLMALRERAPELPIILLSADVSLNDYSVERLSITDVTLRNPANTRNFEIGLLQALENNLVWRGRMEERRQEAMCPCCRDRAQRSAGQVPLRAA